MVWAIPRSLATTCRITIVFFSSGYLDVSVHRVRFPFGMTGLQPAGLPHSDICGSSRMCQSPQLFAAYHVLHRLQEPRHPPHTLKYFLVFFEYQSNPEIVMMLCLILFNFHLPLCQTQIPMNLSFYLSLSICQRTYDHP